MFDRVWWFVIVYNLSLFILIGWCVWFLESLLPLIGLVVSFRYSFEKKG